MDRHMRESLDQWLTTPPEERTAPVEWGEFTITVHGDDLEWIKERMAQGHRFFLTSSVPALHMAEVEIQEA